MRLIVLFWFIGLITSRPPDDSSSPNRFDRGQLKQIPILCYHNICEKPPREDLLFISRTHFDEQIRFLSNNGYHSISPEQLYQYLTAGAPLPSKAIMLTFDDSHKEHYSIAKPILEHYGFRGVFFIMTVTISKPAYLAAAEIKELSDRGHTIAAHTWNHSRVTSLSAHGWHEQIDQPKQLLEKITGKPVDFFAYPDGLWNESSIAELRKHGIKLAFQLTGRPSKSHPFLTLNRIMVSGKWTGSDMKKQIEMKFGTN